MQPLPMFEVISFLEWIGTQDERCVSEMRDALLTDRYYIEPLGNRAQRIARRYIEETGSDIDEYALLGSLKYYQSKGSVVRRRAASALYREELSMESDGENAAMDAHSDFMNFMMATDDVSIVVSFLDWAVKQRISSSKLRMNLDYYLSEYNRDVLEPTNHSLSWSDINAIQHFFNGDCIGQRSGYDRYFDRNMWKCLFLGLSADQTVPNALIDYWVDLNELSGDYLDVFYSTSEISKSGYAIARELGLKDVPYDQLPCIVVWRGSIKGARYITVDNLDERALFRVVASLVMQIRAGAGLDKACEEVRVIVSRLTAEYKERQMIVIKQEIEKNYGIVNGINHGIAVQGANEGLVKELSEAINRIDKLAYLSESQKTELQDSMALAMSDDKSVQQKGRDGFKATLARLGTRAVLVLGVLADLAQVAQFFGI